MKYLVILSIVCVTLSCGSVTQQTEKSFTLASWVSGAGEFDEDNWNKKLDYYASIGISEILVSAPAEKLKRIIPLAHQQELKVHAWMWTLNRPNDTTANKHPEWYAVNRNGQHSLEYRAYVDYYQWLSPFHPDARAYIKSNVAQLCEVDGLASIHLDYVRYVDVILGADLQPKYNIVQDRELPEYDYGYHPIGRQGFKDIFGYDPLDLDHPELSTEWKQYRLNAVSTLVNEIVELAHEKNKKITAAVFPFPEMSRRMVSQAWNDWHLDAAYPMLYHNFYRESINWIGFSTAQGVRDVSFPIHPGLFVSALRGSGDLQRAFDQALDNGASGIALFTADGLTEEQQAAVRDFMMKE